MQLALTIGLLLIYTGHFLFSSHLNIASGTCCVLVVVGVILFTLVAQFVKT